MGYPGRGEKECQSYLEGVPRRRERAADGGVVLAHGRREPVERGRVAPVEREPGPPPASSSPAAVAARAAAASAAGVGGGRGGASRALENEPFERRDVGVGHEPGARRLARRDELGRRAAAVRRLPAPRELVPRERPSVRRIITHPDHPQPIVAYM